MSHNRKETPTSGWVGERWNPDKYITSYTGMSRSVSVSEWVNVAVYNWVRPGKPVTGNVQQSSPPGYHYMQSAKSQCLNLDPHLSLWHNKGTSGTCTPCVRTSHNMSVHLVFKINEYPRTPNSLARQYNYWELEYRDITHWYFVYIVYHINRYSTLHTSVCATMQCGVEWL